MELNVLDFEASGASTAEEIALGAARDGDVVYFPGGIKEYQAPSAGFLITKSIELFGDGPSDPGENLAGTTLVPAGATDTNDVIVVEPTAQANLGRVRLRDFKIARREAGPPMDGHTGLHCRTAHGKNVTAFRIDRVNVHTMNSNGIVVEGVDPQPAGGSVERLLMITSHAGVCGDVGATLRSIGRAAIVQSGTGLDQVDGWLIDRCAAAMYQPAVDANEGDRRGHLTLRSCQCAIVDAAHFENFGDNHAEGCLIEGGDGGGPTWFGAGRFLGQDPVISGVAGLRVASSAEGPVFVGPNHLTRLDELINLQISDGCTVLPQMYLEDHTSGPGNVVLQPGPRVSASSVNFIETSGQSTPAYSGLTVPSKSDGDPTWAVQNGMLYYDSAGNRLRVRIANAWATVLVD